MYYLGWVTVAKNQKSCGSCSAFAQVGMAETSLIKAGAKKEGLDLSEDWLINCRQDGQKDVCKGATITIYAEYMIKTKKLIHEKTSPYMTMGCNETKNFRFSFFFNFSFFGEKWRAKNEKWIFFLFCPFLPKILTIFGDFFKVS